MCHGDKGNGQGFMGGVDSAASKLYLWYDDKDIPDGQLFWIIKNGSPGTGMMSFAGLPDDQVGD